MAADSAALVSNLVAQVQQYKSVFNVFQYNVSWYSVPADEPVTLVHFSNCQHKPKVPAGLYGPGGQFVDVPIPASAAPSVGTDATLSIYRPATDQLWELWKAYRDAHGIWWACWGGRLDHVSSNPGYFNNGFGASASGIAYEGGDVTLSDVTNGVIDHALTLGIPKPAYWRNFVWPAQRSDGSNTDPSAPPEGTRLRLDPNLDISSLHLSPIGAMIARAAQQYGFVITDKAGCLTVKAESGLPTQQITGTNPWNNLLAGYKPYQILQNFPWNHLQVIDPSWHGSMQRNRAGRPRRSHVLPS